MGKKREDLLEFGEYRLDCGQRLVFHHGRPIPLSPKVVETLVVLVESAGRVVEKEQLLKRVWPDSFVEEGSLARNISTLRKALGESPEEERYIQTIPKRGYRFVAPVTLVEAEGSAVGVEEPSVEEEVVGDGGGGAAEPGEGPPARSRRRWVTGGVLVAAIAVVLFAALWTKRYWGRATAPVESIAVLPFGNLSRDPSRELLADGITDALITNLAQVAWTSGDLANLQYAVQGFHQAFGGSGEGTRSRRHRDGDFPAGERPSPGDGATGARHHGHASVGANLRVRTGGCVPNAG